MHQLIPLPRPLTLPHHPLHKMPAAIQNQEGLAILHHDRVFQEDGLGRTLEKDLAISVSHLKEGVQMPGPFLSRQGEQQKSERQRYPGFS